MVPDGKHKESKEPYSAVKFDESLPPDRRLIRIVVDRKKIDQKTVLAVLHEVGHYIGCRHREERKAEYEKLVAYELCRQAYLHTFEEYLRVPFASFPEQVEQDITLSNWVRNIAIDVHSCLSKSIDAENGSGIRRKLQDAMKKFSTEMRNDDLYSDAPELNKRYQRSIDKGYFEMLRPIMYLAVNSILDDVEAGIINCFESDERFNKSVEQAFQKIHGELEPAIQILLGMESTESKKRNTWIDTCAQQFEESAADIFVIRIAKLSTRKYMRLLCEHVWEAWHKKEKPETFSRYMASQTLRSRILAVKYAMQHTGGETSETRSAKERFKVLLTVVYLRYKSIILHKFPKFINSWKIIQKLQALLMLDGMYWRMCNREEGMRKNASYQNILNSQLIVSDYAKEVYHDEDYIKLEKEHRPVLLALRAFKVKNGLLRAIVLRTAHFVGKNSSTHHSSGADAEA